MMRKIIFLFLLLVLAAIFLVGRKVELQPAQVSEPIIVQKQAVSVKDITILLTGDIMLDRGVEATIKKQNDWNWPFLKIADELKKADIVFGNLEGPISDKGEKVGSIYSFRSDPKSIEGLNFADFNVLSLANNHAFDYGRTALEDTFSRLKETGIDYVGGGFNATEAGAPVIKEIGGTKIAFLAYTNLCPLSWSATGEKAGINCVTEKDLEKIKQNISDAKKEADIVIVSLHSGEEYTQKLTQFQIDFSKAAIDAGADFVIGHHPHVVQKYEQYGNGWIFYSLGNFVFDQSFSEETMKGLMVKIVVEDKKIKGVSPINIQINKDSQPEIAEGLTQKTLSQTSVSSNMPRQGDTLFIKIPDGITADEISGKFGSEKISFFKSGEGLAAILGIDAKKTPGKYKLTVNFPDDYKVEKEINVTKRNFPVTELAFTKELEEQGYTATSVVEMIVAKDSVVLKEAFSTSSPTAYFNKAFIYPLKRIIDVGAFGNIRKSEDISLQHLGVDLDAEMDTQVFAANDGIVKATAELI